MRILDARATPKREIVTIECECGHVFSHPTSKWLVDCTCCGNGSSLRYLNAKGGQLVTVDKRPLGHDRGGGDT